MIRFLMLSLLVVSGFTTNLTAAIVAPPAAAAQETIITRASLEAELGRKLTFRERIAVKTMARKQKRETRKARRSGYGYGNGLAIAGFVCGVLSLLGGGFILGVPAIVLSAIGLRKANREGRPHRGLAIAGLVCGIISVALTILVVALLITAFSFGS